MWVTLDWLEQGPVWAEEMLNCALLTTLMLSVAMFGAPKMPKWFADNLDSTAVGSHSTQFLWVLKQKLVMHKFSFFFVWEGGMKQHGLWMKMILPEIWYYFTGLVNQYTCFAGIATTFSQFGAATTPYLWTIFAGGCTGTESTLYSCPQYPVAVTCTSAYPAAVICSSPCKGMSYDATHPWLRLLIIHYL